MERRPRYLNGSNGCGWSIVNSGRDRKVHMVAAEELCDGREMAPGSSAGAVRGHQHRTRRHGSVGEGYGCTLSVCNDGCGLPEGFDPTASKGLGMTLVSSLAAQIGSKLQIDRGDDNECPRFTVLI
jgi:two-component sensor histidine kinase